MAQRMSLSFECNGHLEVRISRFTVGGIGRKYYIQFQDRKKNSINLEFPDLKDFKKTLENLHSVSSREQVRQQLDWAEFHRKIEADRIKSGVSRWGKEQEELYGAIAAEAETKGVDGFKYSQKAISLAKALCKHFGVRHDDKMQFRAVIEIIRNKIPLEAFDLGKKEEGQ